MNLSTELKNFLMMHSNVSIWELNEILESLEDMGMLNPKGAEFKTELREAFIHKPDNNAGEKTD